MQTLEKLYDNFYKSSRQLSLQKEIEENHKILISNLSKADRKAVLRIIDVKDLISGIHKRESFICGFKLALDLTVLLWDCSGADGGGILVNSTTGATNLVHSKVAPFFQCN